MQKTKTRPWDPAEHLETEEDMLAYLEAVLEDGDPRLVVAALGDIARAKGMAGVADEARLSIESGPASESTERDAHLSAVLKTVRALGFKLHATIA